MLQPGPLDLCSWSRSGWFTIRCANRISRVSSLQSGCRRHDRDEINITTLHAAILEISRLFSSGAVPHTESSSSMEQSLSSSVTGFVLPHHWTKTGRLHEASELVTIQDKAQLDCTLRRFLNWWHIIFLPYTWMTHQLTCLPSSPDEKLEVLCKIVGFRWGLTEFFRLLGYCAA